MGQNKPHENKRFCFTGGRGLPPFTPALFFEVKNEKVKIYERYIFSKKI